MTAGEKIGAALAKAVKSAAAEWKKGDQAPVMYRTNLRDVPKVDGLKPPARERREYGCCWCNRDSEEPSMQVVTTVGLDIAKSVFQCTALMALAKWSSAVS
jgi:hypothetical protein